MTNQVMERSPEEIADAIRHSYTGEIDDNTLAVKDISHGLGYSSLATEVIWRH